MQIDDPEFGRLSYDDALDTWTGHLRTSAFAHCRIRWSLDPMSGDLDEWASDATDAGGGVAITVADGGEGTGPGPEQRAALAAFRANESGVAAAVFAEIARIVRTACLTPGHLPEDAPALTSRRSVTERLCTAEGVTEVLAPPRIDFHFPSEGGVGLTSFNFNAGFDGEHGVAVLMLGEQVREVGGSSQFY